MFGSLRQRQAILVALLGLAAAGALAGGVRGAGAPAQRTWSVDRNSSCDTTVRPAGAYSWPVRPFDRPHPVRGNFGDPRTVFYGSTVRDTGIDAGSFQFHNGVDISARAGTRVYAVTDGVVGAVHGDYMVVDAPDRRQFQYWHIRSPLAVGRPVVAGETLLGRVLPVAGHVHLTELDHGHVVNPLAPGHLFPYRDRRPPSVDRVAFRDASGRRSGPVLSGLVDVAAQAHDESSLPVPPPWSGMPVAPARLRWSIAAANGRMVAGPAAAVDFGLHLPLPRDFWKVYEPGTYQNFPVVGGRYYYRTPGRYWFHLLSLDTRTLANGSYRLDVAAGDVCGNVGTLTVPFAVENR